LSPPNLISTLLPYTTLFRSNLCALACPEDCIDVIPMDVEIVVAGKPRRKKVLDEFIFDTSRCMFCALCQEACPTYCLELTQDFEDRKSTRLNSSHEWISYAV